MHPIWCQDYERIWEKLYVLKNTTQSVLFCVKIVAYYSQKLENKELVI